jgi:hypothetical protein
MLRLRTLDLGQQRIGHDATVWIRPSLRRSASIPHLHLAMLADLSLSVSSSFHSACDAAGRRRSWCAQSNLTWEYPVSRISRVLSSFFFIISSAVGPDLLRGSIRLITNNRMYVCTIRKSRYTTTRSYTLEP